MNTTESTPAKAGRRAWFGLAALALPTFVVSMDFSVLYLALPHLSADLAPSGSQQLWIIDIYGFLIAGFLVTMGTLGDRIGRRKLLLIGAAAFGAASLLAAFSPSTELLIASRALLGVAGATLMPSTLALISTMFTDARQRGTAIAVWLSCFMSGLALGPVVGGALLDNFWWGSVFLLAVPVMAAMLIVGPALLPEYRVPNAGRLDLTSVGLSLVTVLPFIYGLKEVARHGGELVPVLALVLGVACGVLFVRRQRRLADPMLDLRLFGNRTFSSALGVLFVAGVVGTGTYLVITLYLQNVGALSPLATGLLLVPPTVLMIIGNLLTPALARRFQPAYLIAGGLFVAALGYLLMIFVGSSGGVAMLLVAFSVAMAGTGPMVALGNHLVIGSAPPEKAGSAVSIMQTGNEFSLGLGVAVLGTVATVVYRGGLDGTIPAGLPGDVDATARESVNGAISAAQGLPGGQGAELLAAAREAFTGALHSIGIISAIAFAVLAGLTAIALRNRKQQDQSGDAHGEPPELSQAA